MTKLSKFTVAVAAVLGLSGAALAQDTMTLRFGAFIPATNNGVKHGDTIFIQELAKLTNGRVKVEHYPAQQAGKAREALALVRSGAVDIYGLGTAYFSADAPLWGLLEAPNMIEKVCDGTRAMREIDQPGGILWEAMYKPLGIRVLARQVYPPYGPSASHRKITKVEDMVGLKMRNAGGLMARTVAALGAVPVALTGPEVLQSLQRGTLDSWMGAYSSVRDFEYWKIAKNGATGFSMGTPGIFAAISESKFQAMPKDIQDALLEAGRRAEENFCQFMEKDEESAIKALQTESYGMHIHTWAPDQVAELAQKSSSVLNDWVKDLDARGVPASDALKAYLAAIKKVR
ncbi:MAG: TRAP transporter substrate-binding protein DctP [Burkholderiaceae bacterium]